MKINKVLVMAIVCFFAQGIDAATFIVSNYSGESVNLQIKWRDSPKVAEDINVGRGKKEYNTWGARIQSIKWCPNSSTICYKCDLSKIDSGVMLNKEFVIYEGGQFQHTFVRFPYKFTSGTGEKR